MLVDQHEPVEADGESGGNGATQNAMRSDDQLPPSRSRFPPRAAGAHLEIRSAPGAPSRGRRARAGTQAGSRSRRRRSSIRSELRARASIAAGTATTEPGEADDQRRPDARRLLLDVGTASRRGWDRPADHAGDGDQGQDVGQGLEQDGRAPRTRWQAGTTSAVEAPKSSAAANAPNGRQLPKMTAASAM